MSKFVANICDTVATGQVFIISGKTSYNAEQFTVSLANGKTDNSEVSLRCLVNLGNGKTTRNSFEDGKWMDEEDDENLTTETPTFIKSGADFKFYILVGEDRFHVSINDKQYCTYKFRMPPKDIKAIFVSGEVKKITQMDHLKVFPRVFPLVRVEQDDAYRGFIPCKFQPGNVISITAVPSGNPDGDFTIVFNKNDTKRQMLHLNVRFDEQSIVANTMDDEKNWSDNEVRSSAFPFAINEPFKFAIATTQNGFKVAVNGQYLLDYSFEYIEMTNGESMWDVLTGFKVKTGMELNLQVNKVEHIQMGDKDCDGFENYSE